jgi:protein-S-isoprenylcysteine O-methyltransferase Ste14
MTEICVVWYAIGSPQMDVQKEKQSGGSFRVLLALPVPWIFVIGYLVGAGLEVLFLPRNAGPGSQLVGTIGIALFVLGAVIAGWAWTIFHRKGTTRVPGEASTALVMSGPYTVTRNPMYVGLTLAYIGEAGMQRQILPLATLLFVLAYVNWIVIPVEEKRLREVFGPAYDAYRLKVRRWL